MCAVPAVLLTEVGDALGVAFAPAKLSPLPDRVSLRAGEILTRTSPKLTIYLWLYVDHRALTAGTRGWVEHHGGNELMDRPPRDQRTVFGARAVIATMGRQSSTRVSLLRWTACRVASTPWPRAGVVKKPLCRRQRRIEGGPHGRSRASPQDFGQTR